MAQDEVVKLSKIFPVGSYVQVSPNPATKRTDYLGAQYARSLKQGGFLGIKAQVICVDNDSKCITLERGEGYQRQLANARPDWLIPAQPDAPKPAPNPAFEQYLQEVARTNAQRDNNLREVFGIAMPPPMDFKTGEVVEISREAKTASGKRHMYAGRLVEVQNVYRNQRGMWAANIKTVFGRQTVSVLMEYMNKASDKYQRS